MCGLKGLEILGLGFSGSNSMDIIFHETGAGSDAAAMPRFITTQRQVADKTATFATEERLCSAATYSLGGTNY